MARNMVRGVGTKGILRDLRPWQLPPEFWTNGRNVRFYNDRILNMRGVTELIYDDTMITEKVITGGIAVGVKEAFVILATPTGLYAHDGFNTYDVTRVSSPYNVTLLTPPEFQMCNGLMYETNTSDVPQVWDIDPANKFVDLANWDATWRAERFCKSGAFIFAMGMVENAVDYPHKLRWSHPAEPGAVPSSWDVADSTYLAGEFNFPDTENGFLRNGLELANRFIVYKENAIWALARTNNNQVFSRTLVRQGVGLESPRSLLSVPGNAESQQRHFFQSHGGFRIYDGVRILEVFEDVFETEFKKLRNETYYAANSYSVFNYKDSEIWFCFPEAGEEYATLALCLNVENGTYSIKELNKSFTIASGIGYSAGGGQKTLLIPFDDGTYYDDGTGHEVEAQLPFGYALVEIVPGTGKVYNLEQGELDYDGTALQCYVERRMLPTIKYDSRDPEATIVDYNLTKLVDAYWPKMYEGSVLFEIGVSDSEREDVNWEYQELLSGETTRVDLPMPLSGRFLSFKVSKIPGEDMAFEGFDYATEPLGIL